MLRKLAQALRDDGALLLSYSEGDGDRWEQGESGEYRVVDWTREDFAARLARAGFVAAWGHAFEGKDRPWRIVLARKAT